MPKPFEFSEDDRRTLTSILAGSHVFARSRSGLVKEALREVLPEGDVSRHSGHVRSMVRPDLVLAYLGTVSVPQGHKPVEILFLEAFMKEVGSKDFAYERVMSVLRNYDGRMPRPYSQAQ